MRKLRFAACAVALLSVFVLAAILLPVFGQGREKARQASCLSNLEQLGLALQAAEDVKKVSGKVTFICPKHKAIKVKCGGGKVWTLWVDEKADNASSIKEQIKKLKVDDSVTVSYCVRDGKNYIKKLEKTG